MKVLKGTIGLNASGRRRTNVEERKMKFLRSLAILSVGLTAMMSAGQEMGPSPELKKMDWMIGKWSGNVKWSIPGTPETEAPMDYECTWDGNFIKSSSTMEMAGMGKMTETGYLGWDAKNSKYVMYVFTNFSHDPRIERGTLDGNKLLMVSDPFNVQGQDIVGRATQTRKDDGSVHFLLEFKMGEEWAKVAEGTFKKKNS